jgi:hypothetical protein
MKSPLIKLLVFSAGLFIIVTIFTDSKLLDKDSKT